MAARAAIRPPEGRPATSPPEERGLERDGVKLLIARPGRISHATFRRLGEFLAPGDVLVVNTSETMPAAVDAVRGGESIVVHFSTSLDDGSWVVELRAANQSGPLRDGTTGELIDLVGGAHLEVLSAYSGIEGRSRTLRCRVAVDGTVEDYLARVGRPISYAYVPERWPLSAYQTVFARSPGSAEMASAARPFTPDLVTELVGSGVVIAPVTLHAGVGSLENGEPPLPERYRVPETTARLINEAGRAGSRVVAVGTTVTRAVETAAGEDGIVHGGAGWTELVLGEERRARVVTGLITGWHAADASHRSLLVAVAGHPLVDAAYAAAVREGYLWHEFGDSCLLLPKPLRAC